MSPSLEYLERCAADSGFAVAILEKVARLGEFAGDVGRPAFRAHCVATAGTVSQSLPEASRRPLCAVVGGKTPDSGTHCDPSSLHRTAVTGKKCPVMEVERHVS